MEKEVLAGEGDYLANSTNAFPQMDLKFSTATEVTGKLVSNTEHKANNNSTLASLKANVEAFGKPSAMLTQIIGEYKISLADLEVELKNVEESIASLVREKTKVQCLDPAAVVDSQVMYIKGYVMP